MIFLNNRFVLFSQRSRSLFVVNVFWFNNELTPNHHHVNPNAYYQVVNEAIRKKTIFVLSMSIPHFGRNKGEYIYTKENISKGINVLRI